MKNSKIISWVLILSSLFIVVLFTKDMFFSLQASFDEKNLKISEREAKKETLDRLDRISKKLKTWTWKVVEISKYLNDLKEDEILDYIYSMAEKKHLWVVKSLSISKGKKNELWFLESNISLVIEVKSERNMKKILDYLVKEDWKYKFFIDSFSYKKPKEIWPNKITPAYDVTIPLKLFYK